MWLSYLFAVLPSPVDEKATTPAIAPPLVPADVEIVGGRERAITDHFVVSSTAIDARQVAALAERSLRELNAMWSEAELTSMWSPRCDIVVHGSRGSYAASIGGGDFSLGSSWIKASNGQGVQRRIDVLVDGEQLPALKHELTHVALADLFGGRRPPPWVDEGIAVLTDDLAKRRLHQRDLRRAYFQRATWPLETLLTRQSYPPASGFATFYAQSASLTAFLVSRGSASQFMRFVKRAGECGYDRALREEYSIAGVADLERLWKTDIALNARLEDGLCQGK